MTQFRPRRQLSAPLVWGPDGKEILPRVGGLVPAGSYRKEDNEFVLIASACRWILFDNGTDDMGYKLAPSFGLKEVSS